MLFRSGATNVRPYAVQQEILAPDFPIGAVSLHSAVAHRAIPPAPLLLVLFYNHRSGASRLVLGTVAEQMRITLD